MIKRIIDALAGNPKIFIWLRRILENNFNEQKKVVNNFFSGREENKVIDIGCGTGEFSVFFEPKNYTGIDIDPAYIEYAKKNYQGKFLIADATKLPFSGQSFDTAVILGVLHHLPDNKCVRIFDEIKRVLKDGAGLLALEDVAGVEDNKITKILHNFDKGDFIRNAEQYRNLLGSNFKIVKDFKIKSGLCPYQVFILEK